MSETCWHHKKTQKDSGVGPNSLCCLGLGFLQTGFIRMYVLAKFWPAKKAHFQLRLEGPTGDFFGVPVG